MLGWAEDAMREAVDILARAGRNDVASDLNRILCAIDFDDLDVLRSPGSELIADEILEATSFSELVDLLHRMSQTLGVSHTTLHVVSEAPSTSFTTKVLTTYPDDWISRYVNRRYWLLDPVAQACLATDHGFFWDSLDRTAPPLHAFWVDATTHGIGPSGYTQPLVTERGDKLAVSVCSAEAAEVFRERLQRYQDDLYALGIYLSDTFCRLASEHRPASFSPTDDQLSILRAIAMGADEAELAGRSYQFGSYKTLQRSICTLFRTKTVAQAAVLAARIGLLADAPLTRADILASSPRAAAPAAAPNPHAGPRRRLARIRNPLADTTAEAPQRLDVS
jgi:hypothetical protein